MTRYIVPSLKFLLVAAIAVALVKIAFFPPAGNTKSADISAGYSVAVQTTPVTVGDISHTISINGQIVLDAPTDVPATMAGQVDSFQVDNGATVEAGTELLRIKHVEPQEPLERTDADGNVTSVPRPDKVTWESIKAPRAGTVTFSVLKTQETSVGMSVASIQPSTYSATGTISAVQQYQLTSAPSSATITINGGPAPFECSNLSIGASAPTTTNQDGSTTTGDATTVQVRCAIPSDQTVFPGLPVTIDIDAGSVSEVLTVPVTAVEGRTGTGAVWVVTNPEDPAAATKTEVELGMTDGTVIEIRSGVEDGTEVLLFVPNKDVVRTGTPNTCEDDGSVCYDENGQEYL